MAPSSAAKRAHALTFIAAFWIDNVFTAFIADAVFECFPYSTTTDFSLQTLMELLIYDASATVFFSALAFVAIYLVERSSSTSRRLTAQFVSYASSFAMGASHKTVVYYTWYGFLSMILGGETVSVGSCAGSLNSVQLVAAAIGYFLLVAAGLTWGSVALAAVAEKGDGADGSSDAGSDAGTAAAATASAGGAGSSMFSPATWQRVRFILQIIAGSLGIAIGWSAFNLTDVVFECEFPFLYKGWGVVLRAAVVTVGGYFVWLKFVEERPPRNPATETGFWERIAFFGNTIINVIVALTVVYAYYKPLSDSTMGDAKLGGILIGIGAAIALAISYIGYANNWEFDDVESRPRIKYVVHIAGWVVNYTFWYGFDYLMSSVLRGQQGLVVSVIFALIIAAAFAALTGLIVGVLESAERDALEERSLLEPGTAAAGGNENEPPLFEGSLLLNFVLPYHDGAGKSGKGEEEEADGMADVEAEEEGAGAGADSHPEI